MRYKNTFVQSKLNKDVDERLLPKGQYPHAENVRVANTDGSDAGAVENVKGNEPLTSFSLTNAKTIGAFSDSSNQKLYWFTTSDEKDMVVEYNTTNSNVSILLESDKPDGILNFNKNNLITGVVKIINGDSDRDLIVWTDDINPPRMINIERAKTYLPNGFNEDDISLIKKPPRFSPEVQLTFTSSILENNLENKFLSFAYRYKYLDGGYSALSSFSNYKFSPNDFDLDYQTMENNGMVNSFNAVNIVFNTGDRQVTDVELVYKESNSNTLFVIETFNKNEENWNDNEFKSFKFFNSKKYTPLSEDELYRQYDNVPKLAKSLELIGNRIVFGNYVEGYDLVNVFGENVDIYYNVSVIRKELEGQQLASEIVSSGTGLQINLTETELVKNSRLVFDLYLEDSDNSGTYSNDLNFILNCDYQSIEDLATDEDFISFVQDIMTSNFLQNYNAALPTDGDVTNNTIFSLTHNSTSITISAPQIEYTINDGVNPPTTQTGIWNFTTENTVFFREVGVNTSLKSNRSYEVGIIYMDEYGRATTVLTDTENTIFVPHDYSTHQNKLLVNINHIPPAWADRYKLVVKQNKGNYQTIYTNIFYEDGLFRWVKLEGANKDKVKEGDTLIVKSDLGGVTERLIKVRVLEISTKEKDFIEDNQNSDGEDIIEESGLYMKVKPVGFDMSNNGATFRTFERSIGLRYPTRVYTSPLFGQYDDSDVFQPFALRAGSTVRIYIEFNANGAIAYNEKYDKTFRVQDDYVSVKEWFEAEVKDLGSFGREYTWDGIRNIGSNIAGCGAGEADDNNQFSGWGFGKEGDCSSTSSEQFFVVPHRKGTAAREIRSIVRFDIAFSEGTVIFETEPFDSDNEIYYETEQTFEIQEDKHLGNIQNQTNGLPAITELDFFNCYVQGNGAESYRYKDAFNIGENELGQKVTANYLNIDLRPTSTSVEKFREVRRYADLTYSSPYNENNNVNGLNEFNLSLANYKEDLDKKYGYIQKLHSRDTDLIVFQEDKVSKVLFGKDLLLNADGTSNLSSIEDVLGQQVTYAGEYGISRNPESFVFDGFNIYFTDAKRGAVMRLGLNGLTEISMYGMRQFFKDTFKDSVDNFKIGGFDPYRDQYVLHPSTESVTLPVNLDCSSSVIRENFTGTQIINIDYGLAVGEAGFTYNITEGLVNIEVRWNNQVVENLNNISGTGTVNFNKSLSVPTSAIINITTNECANFNITGNCIVSNQLNIISLILNDEGDVDLTMKSRYRWSTENYISPFKTYNSVFTEEGVNLYNLENGSEGIGNIPLTGSTIFLESFKGANESANFEVADRLGYLVSSSPISEANYEDIIDNATFIPVTTTTSSSGDISNYISFVFNRPNDENYLYLIWNYERQGVPPVANNLSNSVNKGGVVNVQFDVTDDDGDVLTYEITSLPTQGVLYLDAGLTTPVIINTIINSDTIYYQHNDSTNFVDTFNYKANDGLFDSNIATVNMIVGVSAGESVTANGASGVYLVPFIVGSEAGDLVVHFNAQSVPDRFQILFDTTGQSNDLTGMSVVADSLFVGDGVVSDTSPFDQPANGTTNNLDLFTYNGTSFDTTETGTQSITVTDSIVAGNTGNRSSSTPNGNSRNGSNGVQLGVQDLVYQSSSDTVGITGLNFADGNVALRYSKPVTTSYVAYIRVYGVSGTAWDIYQTEFITT